MPHTVTLGPADLQDNELRGYEVGKRNVMVARVNGEYTAMDDWCNHAGCLLSGGRVEDGLIVCPCHEVGFDAKTGANATSPGVCDDQPLFPIRIENGQLVVDTTFDPKFL